MFTEDWRFNFYQCAATSIDFGTYDEIWDLQAVALESAADRALSGRLLTLKHQTVADSKFYLTAEFVEKDKPKEPEVQSSEQGIEKI